MSTSTLRASVAMREHSAIPSRSSRRALLFCTSISTATASSRFLARTLSTAVPQASSVLCSPSRTSAVLLARLVRFVGAQEYILSVQEPEGATPELNQSLLLRFKQSVHAPYDNVALQDGTYLVTPGEGPRPEMWSYLDPEDANRVTNWATGLSIMVSVSLCVIGAHRLDAHGTISLVRRLNTQCLVPLLSRRFFVSILPCFRPLSPTCNCIERNALRVVVANPYHGLNRW